VSASVGTVYVETSRSGIASQVPMPLYQYQSAGRVFVSGALYRAQSQVAALITTLGSEDVGAKVYVTDTGVLWSWNGTALVRVNPVVIVDTHANRGGYSATIPGQVYWESDTLSLYVSSGGVWVSASSSSATSLPLPLPSTVVADWSVTSGADGPHATCYALGRLWVGYMLTTPGLMEVYTPDDPGAPETLSFNTLGADFVTISDCLYDSTTGMVYVLHNKSTKVVVSSVDPATYALSVVVDDAAHTAGSYTSFCCDGTYLYICTDTGTLLKYRISDGSYINSLTLTFGGFNMTKGHNCRMEGDIRCNPTLTPNNTICYVSSGHTDLVNYLAFAKVDLANWTVLDGAVLPPVGDSIITDDSAQDVDYLYYGCEGGSGRVIRVSKADMSVQTPIDPGVGMACWCVFHDGRFLWAAFQTTSGSGTLARIVPGTLAISLKTLPAGLENPNEILTDGVSFFGTCYTSPGVVWAATGE
jgi:hypothetical protein